MRETKSRFGKGRGAAVQGPKPAFEINEWYEVLGRLRRGEPERFERSISAATARALECYEIAKAGALKRAD